MVPSYTNWRIDGFTRRATDETRDGEPITLGYTEVVTRITTPEWTALVVLDATGENIADLRITSDQPVTTALVRTVPVGDLRAIAREHVQTVDREHAAGSPLGAALADAERASADGLREFAAAWIEWREPSPVSGANRPTTRRDALAERFGISVYTVDKRVRAAREAGLIPPATTGRKRHPKNSRAGQSGRASKENEK